MTAVQWQAVALLIVLLGVGVPTLLAAYALALTRQRAERSQ